jgi:hypothetical protein
MGVGFWIFLVGVACLVYGIKKKSPPTAIVGVVLFLVAFAAWFPHFFPALGTLVTTCANALGTFFGSAFDQ